jgi:hypothetical protein
MTPLDYLVSVYRDETASRAERLEAAGKAAPYVHPRLAAVELTGGDGGPIQVEQPIDFSGLNAEERALMRQVLESMQARLGHGAVNHLPSPLEKIRPVVCLLDLVANMMGQAPFRRAPLGGDRKAGCRPA